jgi:hypothetical protein
MGIFWPDLCFLGRSGFYWFWYGQGRDLSHPSVTMLPEVDIDLILTQEVWMLIPACRKRDTLPS